MPSPLAEQALGAGAGAALSTGLGLLLENHNDRRQLRQQDALNKQQLQIDLAKMDSQQRLALDFWHKTNIGAQKEEIETSGMNPAMMYAMGGAGGSATTGNASGSVSAPNAPGGGSEILGLQMIGAQKALIEAQTKKTKAEAERISGVGTRLGEAQIESLMQGVQNAKAVEALTKVQTGIAEIEQDLKTDSYEDVLNTIKYQARAAEKQLQLLTNEKDISDATKQDKIDTIHANLIGLGIANELKKQQIQLTKEQTKQIVQNIAQGWKALSIQEKNALINLKNSEIAQQNADTRISEFNETARNNYKNNTISEGNLALQKMLNNVTEKEKLTVRSIIDALKILK